MPRKRAFGEDISHAKGVVIESACLQSAVNQRHDDISAQVAAENLHVCDPDWPNDIGVGKCIEVRRACSVSGRAIQMVRNVEEIIVPEIKAREWQAPGVDAVNPGRVMRGGLRLENIGERKKRRHNKQWGKQNQPAIGCVALHRSIG